MERSKVEALADNSLHILVDDAGVAVNGSAVENPVADGRDLLRILDDAMVLVLESVHNHLDGNGVVRHGAFNHILVLVSRLMGQLGTVDADSLAQALCDDTLVVHVDELIL